MQVAFQVAIAVIVAMNLAGLPHANGPLAAFCLVLAAMLCGLRVFGVLPLGRRRHHWHALMLRHRPALTKRYRQVVRVNAYGYEELGKWLGELDRFRVSIGLDLDEGGRDAFDRMATRVVRRWAEAADGAPLAADIDGLTPEDYEHHCADLLRRAGWRAEVTGMSGDQGVDVMAVRERFSVAIQCKLHFAGPVGNKAVQEAHAAAGYMEARFAAVVSNADYTRGACQLADKLGVLLLHHSDLPKLDGLLPSPLARAS